MGFDAFLRISFSADANIREVLQSLQQIQIPDAWNTFCSLRGHEVYTGYLEHAQIEQQQHIYLDDIVTYYPESIPDDIYDDTTRNAMFYAEFRKFLDWCLEKQKTTIRFYYVISY